MRSVRYLSDKRKDLFMPIRHPTLPGTLRQRNSVWYCCFVDKGKEVVRTTRKRDFKEALIAAQLVYQRYFARGCPRRMRRQRRFALLGSIAGWESIVKACSFSREN